MADIEVFLQEIRRKAPKADEYSLMDAVVRAARIFCKQSWYVRRSITFTTAAPAAPQNVSVTPGNAQVTLQWDPVPNALSYTVNVGTVSGRESPNLTLLGTSAGVVINLTNAQQYFFTVQAVNGVGASPASTEVSATPQSANSNTAAAGVPLIFQYVQKLDLPGDEEVIGVRSAQFGTFSMAPASPRDMDPKFGPGRPIGFNFTPNGNLMLYPPPNVTAEVLLLAAVQPKLGSTQLPDEIAENYLDGIGYGALKDIYDTPPWKDPSERAYYTTLFDNEVQRAKREAITDFQSGNMRVQPYPFIIRSIV